MLFVRAAAVFSLLSSAQSRVPSIAEKAEILEEARRGNDAHELFLEARKQIEELPRGSYRWREAAREAVRADGERRLRFNRAIALTQAAYGIRPSTDSGVIANGPFSKHGLTAQWKPHFEPDDLWARRVSDGRVDHYLYFKPAPDQLGDTWEDGEVIIRPLAFAGIVRRKNPGLLAFIIHHEAVHFSRLVTTGWGTKEEEEEIAYGQSLKAADSFGLDDIQKRSIRRMHRKHFWHVWAPIYPLGPKSSGLFHGEKDDKPHEVRYLYQLELARPFEEAKHAIREEGREIPRNHSEPVLVRPETPPPMRSFDSRGAALQLANLAKKACADPENLRSADVAVINAWFPDPRSSLSVADWMGLSGCAYDLYIWIREKNSMARGYQLQAGEIALAAGAFRAENAPPTRRVSPIGPAPGVSDRSRPGEPACSVQSGVRGCPR